MCRYEGGASGQGGAQFITRLDTSNWLSHQSDLIRACVLGVQHVNEFVLVRFPSSSPRS